MASKFWKRTPKSTYFCRWQSGNVYKWNGLPENGKHTKNKIWKKFQKVPTLARSKMEFSAAASSTNSSFTSASKVR